MAPKKKVDTPQVVPEPNPEDELPQEIKDLEEPPFEVKWLAVNSIVCLTEEIKPAKLRETLKRKELVRTPALFDLVLRLDPAGKLFNDIKPSMDEHIASGQPIETFVPHPEHAVEVLKLRFERDRRIDWKVEAHRRAANVKTSEEAVKAAEEALACAKAELESAEAAFSEYEEKHEAQRLAALDQEEDGADGENMDNLSLEESAYRAAVNTVGDCSNALEAAKEGLASARSSMAEPFEAYPNYWIDGLGQEVQAVISALRNGLDLTAVVWGKPLPPAGPVETLDVIAEEGGGKVEGAAGEVRDSQAGIAPASLISAPAAEGTTDEEHSAEGQPAQPGVHEPPQLHSALQEAVKNPAWEDALAMLVTLEVQLPPSPPKEEPPPVDPKAKKGKPGSASKSHPSTPKSAKGKKGAVEEPPPPAPPPEDAPGWDILAELFSTINTRAKVYRSWRESVTVHQFLSSEEDNMPPSMDVYDALMQGVPSERVSVMVMMHAMLEQVATNMEGDSSISSSSSSSGDSCSEKAEGEEERMERLSEAVEKEREDAGKEQAEAAGGVDLAAATEWVLTTLEHAFEEIDAGASSGSIFREDKPPGGELSLIVWGDDVTAAARGYTVGRLREREPLPSKGRGGEGKNGTCPESPNSILHSSMAMGAAGATEADDSKPQPSKANPLVSALQPRGAVLDVDAVEAYMQALLQIPGVKRWQMPPSPEISEVERALKLTSLKAQSTSELHPNAVRRQQLLQAFVDMLPEKVSEPHADEIMARTCAEEFSLEALRQVVANAQLEYTHSSARYHPLDDCMLLALYAGDSKRHDGLGVPVTTPFSVFWGRASEVEIAEDVEMPHTVYRVQPDDLEYMTSGKMVKYQFGDDGSILATGINGPLTIYKGGSIISYMLVQADYAEEEKQSSALRTEGGSESREEGGQAAAAGDKEGAMKPASPSRLPKKLTQEEVGCTQLLAQLHGGVTVCASKVLSAKEDLALSFPTQEEVDAAMAQAEAAVASAAAAAEALAALKAEAEQGSKPGSKAGSARSKSPSRAATPKGKGKKGAAADAAAALAAAQMAADSASETAAITQAAAQALAAEAAKAPPMPLPQAPIYSISVTLPDATVYEMTTEGYLTVHYPPAVAVPVAPARGVDVPGAPIPAGDLKPLLPQPVSTRTFTSSGALINRYDSGNIRILHPDGTVSERVERIEGWVALTGAPGGGWKRTLLNGRCIIEPDPGCSLAEDAEDLPRQVEGEEVPAEQISDPDTKALATIREDLVMHLKFSAGDVLLQDAESSTISTIPGHGVPAWSVECPGLPVVFSNGKDMSMCIVEGVQLSWSSDHAAVSCSLPDGSSIVVLANLAVWIPASHTNISAELVAFTNRSLVSNGAQEGDVIALSEAPPLKGAAVFNMLNGAASLSAPVNINGKGVGPLHFVIAPGGQEVVEWVEPLQSGNYHAHQPKISNLSSEGSTSTSGRKVSHSGSIFLQQQGTDADLAPAVHPRLFVIQPSGNGLELLTPPAVADFFKQADRTPGAVLTKQLLPGSEEPGVVVHSLLGHLPQHSTLPLPLSLGNVVMEQRRNPRAAELNSNVRPPSSRQRPAVAPTALSQGQFLPRVLGFQPPAPPSPPRNPVLVHRSILEFPALTGAQLNEVEKVVDAMRQMEERQNEMKQKHQPLKDHRPHEMIGADAQALEAILEMRKLGGGKRSSSQGQARQHQGGLRTRSSEAGGMRSRPSMPMGGLPTQLSKTGKNEFVDEFKAPEVATKQPVLTSKQAAMQATCQEVEALPSFGLDEEDEDDDLAYGTPTADQNINHSYSPERSSRRLPARMGGGTAPISAALEALNYPPLAPPMSPTPSRFEQQALDQMQGYMPVMMRGLPLESSPGQQAAPAGLPDHMGLPPGSAPRPASIPSSSPSPSGSPAQGMDAGSEAPKGPLCNRPMPAPLLSWAPRPAGPKFSLSPGHLHFGTVPLGSVTHSAIRLRNGGRQAASYLAVKPDLPLRVIQKPGPVAPGAEAIITAEFVAERVGNFVGEIVINAGTQMMKLSVSAKVLDTQ